MASNASALATPGEKVIVYIDGFNLYNGLKEKGWRHYLWLDLPAFAQHLLKPHQRLVGVKYFTTRVGGPADSVKRQSTYIDALNARGGTEIIFGGFVYSTRTCYTCGATWKNRDEKRTVSAFSLSRSPAFK